MNTDNVLILDVETTGFEGLEAGDSILSIGIARVDIQSRTVSPVFYTPIYQELTEQDRDAWIFKKKHMDVSEITGAPWGDFIVAGLVASIIDGMTVTTYNTKFDLDLFLDPWLEAEFQDDAPHYFRAPCIMKACTQVPEIPRTMHEDGSCWPSLLSSYVKLRDPKEIRQTHNALDDAMMAGEVLLELIRRGLYDPEREEEYA